MDGSNETGLGGGASAKPAERYEVLDSWRGIAALLVVIYHVYETPSHISNVPLIQHGLWFVDYFFVLSGFVISHAYAHRLGTAAQLRSFVIQRIGRIYPLHVAMLALFVLTEIGKVAAVHHGITFAEPPFTGRNTLFGIFTNLTLIHSFGFHPDGGSWNRPSWSIGVEFYTYLIFAAVIWKAKAAKAIFIGLIAVSALIIVNNPPSYLGDALVLGIVRCVYGFLLGHFVWRLSRRLAGAPDKTGWIRRHAAPLEFGAIAAVMIAVSAIGFEPVSVILPLLFCPVVLIFSFGAGPLSRVLKMRVFLTLGVLSYSIYMTHDWIIWLFNIVFTKLVPRVLHLQLTPGPALGFFGTNPWLGDAMLLLVLGCVVAFSTLTYRFIEVPGRDYFKALARGKSGAADGVGSGARKKTAA